MFDPRMMKAMTGGGSASSYAEQPADDNYFVNYGGIMGGQQPKRASTAQQPGMPGSVPIMGLSGTAGMYGGGGGSDPMLAQALMAGATPPPAAASAADTVIAADALPQSRPRGQAQLLEWGKGRVGANKGSPDDFKALLNEYQAMPRQAAGTPAASSSPAAARVSDPSGFTSSGNLPHGPEAGHAAFQNFMDWVKSGGTQTSSAGGRAPKDYG